MIVSEAIDRLIDLEQAAYSRIKSEGCKLPLMVISGNGYKEIKGFQLRDTSIVILLEETRDEE